MVPAGPAKQKNNRTPFCPCAAPAGFPSVWSRSCVPFLPGPWTSADVPSKGCIEGARFSFTFHPEAWSPPCSGVATVTTSRPHVSSLPRPPPPARRCSGPSVCVTSAPRHGRCSHLRSPLGGGMCSACSSPLSSLQGVCPSLRLPRAAVTELQDLVAPSSLHSGSRGRPGAGSGEHGLGGAGAAGPPAGLHLEPPVSSQRPPSLPMSANPVLRRVPVTGDRGPP